MTQEFDQTVEGADQKQGSRGWRIAKRVGLGALLLIASLVVVVMVLYPPPENKLGLGGSLKIDADPGLDVYIGNRHVGQARWN